MERIWETMELAGRVALAGDGGGGSSVLLFYELDLKTDDVYYRFSFVDDPSMPTTTTNSLLKRPQIWTKTRVTRDEMMAEIEETLARGGVDVSDAMDPLGDCDTSQFLAILGTLPAMSAQLMQHRGWHTRNMLKMHLVFRGSSGTVMPEPISARMLPGETPLCAVSTV